MNIDDMTFGQLKQIAVMFQATTPVAVNSPHPFVGKYVVCRCYGSGVHAGTLVSLSGQEAILQDSRRLWTWSSKETAVALSGVAQTGLKSGCKIDVVNPLIAITDVIEVIPCSSLATESIKNYA